MRGFLSVLREAVFSNFRSRSSNVAAKQIGCMTVFQGVKYVQYYIDFLIIIDRFSFFIGCVPLESRWARLQTLKFCDGDINLCDNPDSPSESILKYGSYQLYC